MTTLVAQSDRQRLVFAPHFRSLNFPPEPVSSPFGARYLSCFQASPFSTLVPGWNWHMNSQAALTTTVGLRWRALDTTSYAEAIWPLAVLAVVRVGF